MQITEVAGVTIVQGDALESLRAFPDRSIHCCVTSPPYWGLRDYGVAGQLGLEPTPNEYVENLVAVFREVRRVLRDDGTLWLNLGDSYTGSGKGGNPDAGKQATNKGSQSIGVLYGKTGATAREAALTNVSRRWTTAGGVPPKNLIGIPWRVAFALQADGWYLRQDIIWAKPNPMPESVRDRCTKSHEYIFLLAKSEKYYFDCDAIRQPYADKTKSAWGCDFKGRGDGTGLIAAENMAASIATHEPHPKGANKRDVWTVTTKPFKEAHFATFPPDLIEPCVLAGCPVGGTVLDPFGGAGTTGLVAQRHGRLAVLLELNPEYTTMAANRIAGDALKVAA